MVKKLPRPNSILYHQRPRSRGRPLESRYLSSQTIKACKRHCQDMISKHAKRPRSILFLATKLKSPKLGSRRCHLRARVLETLRGRFELDLAVIHSIHSHIDILRFSYCSVCASNLTKQITHHVSENGLTETLLLVHAVTVTQVGS